MNEGLVRAIRTRKSSESSDDLLRLWLENDRGTYSDEAFEAVRLLLAERGVTPPAQDDPPPVALRAPPALSAEALRERDPAAAAFWGGLLRPLLWIGVAMAMSKLLQFAAVIEAYVFDVRWNQIDWSEWGAYTMLFTTALQGALPLALLAGVYHAMRWRQRARAVLLFYAWASMGLAAFNFAGTAYGIYFSFTRTPFFQGVGRLNVVEPVVFPLLLVFLLRRPQVRQLFDPTPAGFEVQPATVPESPPRK
jgi:hypothetical protein